MYENKIKTILAICPEKISDKHKDIDQVIIGNSVHIFDLISYMTGKVIKIKSTEVYDNFINVNYSTESCKSNILICTLNSSTNTEVRIFFDNSNVLKISPIEEAIYSTSMKIIEPDESHPSRRYKPNNKEFYERKFDTQIKQGFLELIKDIVDNGDALKLPTLQEHIYLLNDIDQMIKSWKY